MHAAVFCNVRPITYAFERGGPVTEGADDPVARLDLHHMPGTVLDAIQLRRRADDLALDVVTGRPDRTIQFRDLEVAFPEVSDACE